MNCIASPRIPRIPRILILILILILSHVPNDAVMSLTERHGYPTLVGHPMFHLKVSFVLNFDLKPIADRYPKSPSSDFRPHLDS